MFGLEDTHCLAYDNPVPADRAYELQERQTAVAGGWRTPNEARIEEGKEPIDDEFADRLLVNGQPIGGAAGGFGGGLLSMDADPADSGGEAGMDGYFASSLLQSVRERKITCYTATKMLQQIGFPRSVAERMVEAEEKAADDAAKREKIHRMPGEPFDDCVERGIEVVLAEGYDRDQAVAMAYAMCEGSKRAADEKAIEDVDLQPTEQMAALAERGLKLREEYGRGGTEVGVARARDIKNRANLSPETVGRMANFFSRHRVDLEAPAADPSHEDYPSAGVIAWLLWGGDPSDPDGAGAAWAERKMDELERAEEKADETTEEKACGCGCETVTKAAKVYEWPEETKWYRLSIEGLEDDYDRLRPKAAEDEPTADDDIRDGERKTPAMAIRSIVEDGLQQVQTRLVRALESGEVSSTPKKANGREKAIRKILEDLAGVSGKMLEDLVAAFESAARGGQSVGTARINEILAATGAGRLSVPAISDALAKALQKRAALIVQSVVDETVRAFDSGLGQTFSIEKEIERLRSGYGYSRDRAEVIARTESANAYHEGQIDAWKQSEAVEEKHFLMAPKACEFCRAVERRYGPKRKALPIDAPMVKAGETITGASGQTFTPGVSSMGIVHPNCRCDFVPVLKDFG
jgi:hypothetical protein